MSATQHVILLRDKNDPEYIKMARAIEALIDAGIEDLPDSLKEYFGISETCEYVKTGLEVDPPSGAITEYRDEMRDGYDIHVDRLPPGVKVIRAYTSY